MARCAPRRWLRFWWAPSSSWERVSAARTSLRRAAAVQRSFHWTQQRQALRCVRCPWSRARNTPPVWCRCRWCVRERSSERISTARVRSVATREAPKLPRSRNPSSRRRRRMEPNARPKVAVARARRRWSGLCESQKRSHRRSAAAWPFCRRCRMTLLMAREPAACKFSARATFFFIDSFRFVSFRFNHWKCMYVCMYVCMDRQID